MAFVLVRNGKRMPIGLGGSRTLAEILSDDEYERVRDGSLVAVTEGGGLMSLDSPLAESQVVTLRPLRPEKDLAGFGFNINRAGDIVGISEMLAVRKYEELHGEDVYDLSLDEIRERVRIGDRGASEPAASGATAQGAVRLTDLKAALASAGAGDFDSFFLLVRQLGPALASAQAGDFDSFLLLVRQLGSIPSLTFDLSVRSRGSVTPVLAFKLQVTPPDVVTYHPRGVLTRKRQELPRQDFHHLQSISSIHSN
jgi:hypothetical protein